MTKRLIVLELDESVTATRCGDCDRIDDVPGYAAMFGCRRWCDIYGNVDDGRSPSCVDAEQRAARMVEIDPADARDCTNDGLTHAEASARVTSALVDHGRKA